MAIDPNTGDVIALVSTPGFDPNPFGRGLTNAEYGALRDNIDIPLLNRAIRGEYPPGSTVKPAIALGGLTLGVTTPQHTKSCPGYLHAARLSPPLSRLAPEWSRRRRDGNRDRAVLRRVLLRTLLDAGRRETRRAGSRHFGLGAATDIDIGGERRGILPTPAWKKARFKNAADQIWFPGETVSFGIGQGYLIVTPMQAAHMASILASRGKSFQPRLVTAYREQGTGKIEKIAPKLLETVEASPENWKIITDGMVRVMNGGTGSRSQAGAEYQIAGKTGTAQVFTVKQNESYKEMEARGLSERLLDHGWFIAFAPADAPKLAVAVIIENGKHGTTAAPIARRVLDQYLLGRTTTPEIPRLRLRSRPQLPPAEAPGDE